MQISSFSFIFKKLSFVLHKFNWVNTRIQIELLWWLFTIILTLFVILPIYTSVGESYPFYMENIISVIVFITFTRWIFLLAYTPFARVRWVKLGLIFLPIPLFFYLLNGLYDFQNVIDNTGFDFMFSGMNTDDYLNMLNYIKYEYIFFIVGAMITLFLLPVRMIVSIWRVINRGTI